MARRRLGSGSSRPRLGSFAGRLWQHAGVAGCATALAALLILTGALAVFVPYLLRKRTFSAGVPAPPALYAVAEYALAPGQRACMASVAVEPGARIATFAARPASGATSPTSSPPSSGPSSSTPSSVAPRAPIELTLRAPGYAASALAPGGRGYRQLSVAIDPPRRAVLASACFVDRGRAPVALDGSNEARTVSRSAMTVAGASVVGDVALAFAQRPRRSLLSGLRVLFARASALTDGLVPVWLIWMLAVLVALGVPAGTLLALHWSLRQDEQAASS